MYSKFKYWIVNPSDMIFMLIYIISLFVISIVLAVFSSKSIFKYDDSAIKRNKIIFSSIAMFFLVFAVLNSLFTKKVEKYFHTKDIAYLMIEAPVLVSMKKYKPEQYKSIQKEVDNPLSEGKSKKEIVGLIKTNITKIALEQFPYTQDSIIIDYTELMIEQIKLLQYLPNDICFKFITQDIQGEDITSYLSEEIHNKEFLIFDEIIKSSNLSLELPSEYVALSIGEPVYQKIDAKYEGGLAMFDNPNSPNVDRQTLCDMSIDLYSEILKLPKQDAATVLRWLFGS